MADFSIKVNETLDLNFHADGSPADLGVIYVMSDSSKAVADFDVASGLITPKKPGTILVDVLDSATKAPVAQVIVEVQSVKKAQLEADIKSGVKKFVRDFVKAAKAQQGGGNGGGGNPAPVTLSVRVQGQNLEVDYANVDTASQYSSQLPRSIGVILRDMTAPATTFLRELNSLVGTTMLAVDLSQLGLVAGRNYNAELVMLYGPVGQSITGPQLAAAIFTAPAAASNPDVAPADPSALALSFVGGNMNGSWQHDGLHVVSFMVDLLDVTTSSIVSNVTLGAVPRTWSIDASGLTPGHSYRLRVLAMGTNLTSNLQESADVVYAPPAVAADFSTNAAGVTVTASSFYNSMPGFAPTMVFDNDDTTRWATNAAAGEFIEFQLPAGVYKRLSELRIKPAGNEVKDLSVYGSNDNGASYTSLGTVVVGSQQELQTIALDSGIGYNKFKFRVDSGYDGTGHCSIWTLQLWGVDAAAPAAPASRISNVQVTPSSGQAMVAWDLSENLPGLFTLSIFDQSNTLVQSLNHINGVQTNGGLHRSYDGLSFPTDPNVTYYAKVVYDDTNESAQSATFAGIAPAAPAGPEAPVLTIDNLNNPSWDGSQWVFNYHVDAMFQPGDVLKLYQDYVWVTDYYPSQSEVFSGRFDGLQAFPPNTTKVLSFTIKRGDVESSPSNAVTLSALAAPGAGGGLSWTGGSPLADYLDIVSQSGYQSGDVIGVNMDYTMMGQPIWRFSINGDSLGEYQMTGGWMDGIEFTITDTMFNKSLTLRTKGGGVTGGMTGTVAVA